VETLDGPPTGWEVLHAPKCVELTSSTSSAPLLLPNTAPNVMNTYRDRDVHTAACARVATHSPRMSLTFNCLKGQLAHPSGASTSTKIARPAQLLAARSTRRSDTPVINPSRGAMASATRTEELSKENPDAIGAALFTFVCVYIHTHGWERSNVHDRSLRTLRFGSPSGYKTTKRRRAPTQLHQPIRSSVINT
jgi:hypothetical protein